MRPTDFRFAEQLQVRGPVSDGAGLVFKTPELGYFDTVLSGYWRALALPYAAAMAQLQGVLRLRRTMVEFHAPVHIGEVLDIGLRCQRVGRSSINFAGAVFRGDRRLLSGEMVCVFADAATRAARPVPPALRQLLEGFEAGEPVVQLRTGDWAALGHDAAAVRTAVFVEEQGIAPEEEWDAADQSAWHAVVSNRLGQPVGTGRLLQDGAGVGRIGRMAVLRPLRGAGIGEAVIEALENAARARGDRELRLSAQRSAEGFYRRLGYVPYGAPFEEVGIAHIGMARRLDRRLDGDQMSSTSA